MRNLTFCAITYILFCAAGCQKPQEIVCASLVSTIEVPDGEYVTTQELVYAYFRLREDVEIPDGMENIRKGYLDISSNFIQTARLNRLSNTVSVNDSLYTTTNLAESGVDIVHDRHRGDLWYTHTDDRRLNCPNGFLLGFEGIWQFPSAIENDDHIWQLYFVKDMVSDKYHLRVRWSNDSNLMYEFTEPVNVILDSWDSEFSVENDITIHSYLGPKPMIEINPEFYELYGIRFDLEMEYNQ